MPLGAQDQPRPLWGWTEARTLSSGPQELLRASPGSHLPPPDLGIEPTFPAQPCGVLHESLCRLPMHTAPLATLGGEIPWGAPWESLISTQPSRLPSQRYPPTGGPCTQRTGRRHNFPCPEALPAIPMPESLWQDLVEPGTAALNSFSPLGTFWKDSIAKNQFQCICQIPGNPASMQVPRGPSPCSS